MDVVCDFSFFVARVSTSISCCAMHGPSIIPTGGGRVTGFKMYEQGRVVVQSASVPKQRANFERACLDIRRFVLSAAAV